MWVDFCKNIPRPCIMMGDLNSNHPSWGSTNYNSNGRIIYNSLDETDLVFLNDGSPTRLTLNNTSAVDMTLISPCIATQCNWSTHKDVGSSDHFPTICELSNFNPVVITNNNHKRNFKRANWNLFHELALVEPEFQKEVITYNTFYETLNNIADKTIPFKNQKVNPKYNNPWWDEDCRKTILNRKNNLKKFSISPNLENYINLKKSIATSIKLFKKKKKESFRNFCSKLNRNYPTNKIWNTIKAFKKGNNNITTTLPNTNMANQILQNLTSNGQIFDIFNYPDLTNIQPFSLEELKFILNNKKDTTPGLDQISYSMLRNLPTQIQKILIKLYNNILEGAPIPGKWKEGLIIPLLKQNKDPSHSDNYRAIVLSSCVGKILENMVKNRLVWEIENKEILKPLQFGFRGGKGCTDCLTLLFTEVLLGFSKNEFTIAVMLDIKGAYDCVNIKKLIRTLTELNIPDYLTKLVENLLTGRSLYIKDNLDNILGPQIANQGLPQGSPLSPTLFNLYTRSIFNITRNSIQILQYADDITLLVKGKDINHMTHTVNTFLNALNIWLMEHNFQLSTAKSRCILFRKGKGKNINPSIIFNGEVIPWVNQIRYLGVIFDNNLKWDQHVEHLEGKVGKNLNIMKALCGTWWGSDPKTMLMVYKGIIQSHLDYGGFLLIPNNKKTMYKLNKMQYQGLRIITGCMRSTPTTVLLAETGEYPITLRWKWLASKYLLKIKANGLHPVYVKLINLKPYCDLRQDYWKNRDNPILVTLLEETETLSDTIHTYPVYPCYEIDLNYQLSHIKIHNINECKQDSNTQEIQNKINSKFENYIHIYTDGSFEASTGKSGIGVYSPNKKFSFASRLPNHTQICTAEIIAINKALCFILENNWNKAVILSDSKSALQKITAINFDVHRDYASLATKRGIIDALNNNIDIQLGWIPGHMGIKGNQVADQLANLGRNMNIPMNVNLDKGNFLPKFKYNIKEEWKTLWKELIKKKGSQYANITTELPNTIWFNRFEYKNRRHLTTIIRMKSGHCLTPYHLFKINRMDNPFCECGQVGTLNHIMLECPINISNIFNLYQELAKNKIPTPISIFSLLNNINSQSLKLINKFLDIYKIKL